MVGRASDTVAGSQPRRALASGGIAFIIASAVECGTVAPTGEDGSEPQTDDTQAPDTADTGLPEDDTSDTSETVHPLGWVGSADAIFRCLDRCMLGSAADLTGDLDGDGLADLVIGAATNEEYNSEILVFKGPVAGEYASDDATAEVKGEHHESGYELTLTDVADINQDGFSDVIASDPSRSTNAEADGGFFVYSGPLGGVLDGSDADVFVAGETAWAMAWGCGAANLDGDGHSDLLGWGIRDDEVGGTAGFVMLGPVTSDRSMADADVTLLVDKGIYFWPYLFGAGGDLDGDGIDELVANLEGQIGVFLDLTPGVGSMSDPDAELALTTGDTIGPTTFAGGGDLDGDGYQDLLVGVPYWTWDAAASGGVFVHRGPITASRSMWDDAYARLDGYVPDAHVQTASWAGDGDGDGHEDLLVSSYEADWEGVSNAGLAWLVRGPVSGAVSLADSAVVFTPEGSGGDGNDGDGLGYRISTGGDVNADDYPDLLLGAPGEDSLGAYTGSAYLFYGGPWVAKGGSQ